jgi:hypothetical protein
VSSAATVVTQRAATAPGASAQDIVERFRRHFAAGDLQAILLLLTDDARIATLGGAPAGNGGADFFEATLKKTLRLTDLRLDRDNRQRLVANGALRRPRGRATDTGGAAEPAGEVRLELTGEDAGYRISALLYRIDLKTPEPRN